MACHGASRASLDLVIKPTNISETKYPKGRGLGRRPAFFGSSCLSSQSLGQALASQNRTKPKDGQVLHYSFSGWQKKEKIHVGVKLDLLCTIVGGSVQWCSHDGKQKISQKRLKYYHLIQ